MSMFTSTILIILLGITFPTPTLQVRGTGLDFNRQCEPIKIDLCRNIGYNVTAMPNFAGQDTQTDAELQFQTFAPLIQYGCSSKLKFFLCSVFTPMCTEKVPQNIGPCKGMCQSVKARCEPVMLEFGFSWPKNMDCDTFPEENNHLHMCMEGPKEEEDLVTSSTTVSPKPAKKPYDGFRPIPSSPSHSPDKAMLPSHVNGITSPCSHMRHSHEFVFLNRTGICQYGCTTDMLFSQENKQFADTWLTIWSVACLLATAFTIITFISDAASFSYPERIIVIMSATYFMYSLGYLVRIVLGREAVSCHLDIQHNQQLLVTDGPDNVSCTVVFVLLYYFGMASSLWWVNLTVTWFLSSGLKWSPDAIQRKGTYFHLFAWLVPAAQTLAILITRQVDADELTGTCFVGNHNRSTLLAFVIVPGVVYISLGGFFLLAKFLVCHNNTYSGSSSIKGSVNIPSSCSSNSLRLRTSSTIRPATNENQKLLNLRVGFFAFFYLLPASFLIAAYIYEYVNREGWFLASSTDRPLVEIFTLKIFMGLFVGIKSGCWIFISKNTMSLWNKKVWTKEPKSHKPTYLVSVPPLPMGHSLSLGRNYPSAPTIDARGRLLTLGKGGETTV